MLDLNQLAKPKKVIVPVFGGRFVFDKKGYFAQAPDGWHHVEIQNNRAKAIEPAFAHEIEYPRTLGYTYNNQVIFKNFDVAKRKWRFSLKAELLLNGSPTFEAVKVVVWEDRNVFWVEPDYAEAKLPELKDLLENDQDIAHQTGITPEMRTVFLFHLVERSNLKKILEEAKNKAEHARLMATIPGRLNLTLQRAGAELLNYSMTGNRIVVDWKLAGSDTRYNSVIDSTTWMTLEAGYCMTRDDRRHNLTSLVKTAEEYEQRRVTFITRRPDDGTDGHDPEDDW